MGTLSGKAALITGASRGIGEATARYLADGGVKVALAARTMRDIRHHAGAIRENGGTALAIACDVSRYEDVAAAVAKCEAELGGLHILVNNAGVIEPVARLAESSPADWCHAADINYKGVYFGLRAARVDTRTFSPVDNALHPEMRHVIVLGHAMNESLVRTYPSALAGASTGLEYSHEAAIVIQLASYIRHLGYQATASMNDTATRQPPWRSTLTRMLNATKPTAGKAISPLCELGVLQEIGDRKRGRTYRYGGLLSTLRDHLAPNSNPHH